MTAAVHRAIPTILLATLILPYEIFAHDGHDHGTRKMASGKVFVDENANGTFDAGEPILPDVFVSNGREIIASDREGYDIPIHDDEILFVIKPRGYRTKISDDQLPRHYYIHKPNGSPASKVPGVAPTGDLPASIDFPLYPQEEGEKFSTILFGDPQPRNQLEIDYLTRDVVEPLIGTDAAFGVTLGDIMFDDITLFGSWNGVVSQIGVPWYNVIGNHDLNFEATEDRYSDETFERIYGPAYYSFNYGQVHFVVLDDVVWTGRNNGHYHAGLGEKQVEFVKNDLARVPKDQLVVMMMHIPLVNSTPWEDADRRALYELIKDRRCVSISAHEHHHEHMLIGEEDGFPSPKKHHHIVNVTACGSWWRGAKNEYGIPHATMSDGAPNGYSKMHFEGNTYRLQYFAATRPDDYQMHLDAPAEVKVGETGQAFVYANVFNAVPDAKVEMRVGAGGWNTMEKTREADPYFVRVSELENSIPNLPALKLPGAKRSPHLWKAKLPADLKAGTYTITVRGETHDGQKPVAKRIVRVVE